MQTIVALLLFLLIFIGLPIVAGYFLGKTLMHRLPEWVGFVVLLAGGGAILALMRSVPNLPQSDQGNYLVLYMYTFFSWMFFSMTMLIGRRTTKDRQENERLVAAWQQRLAKDESTTGNPLIVAYDLQRLGELNDQLGRYDNTLKAYERAYAIFVKELSDHPQARTFYYSYAQALRRAKRDNEAIQVEQYAATIGGSDNPR